MKSKLKRIDLFEDSKYPLAVQREDGKPEERHAPDHRYVNVHTECEQPAIEPEAKCPNGTKRQDKGDQLTQSENIAPSGVNDLDGRIEDQVGIDQRRDQRRDSGSDHAPEIIEGNVQRQIDDKRSD